MPHTIEKLRKMSDEELILAHDQLAKHTVVSTKYYVDELNRRSREKFEKTAFRLSLLSAIASIAAVVTSIISIAN